MDASPPPTAPTAPIIGDSSTQAVVQVAAFSSGVLVLLVLLWSLFGHEIASR